MNSNISQPQHTDLPSTSLSDHPNPVPEQPSSISYNKKGWEKWLIVYAIIAAILYAAVYYFFLSKRNTNLYSTNSTKPTEAQSALNSSPRSTDNWQTYTNPKYGYEIKIPKNWFVDQESTFESQSFEPSKALFCGGAAPGVFITILDNHNNLSTNDFFKEKMQKANKQYEGLYSQVKIINDRLGFSNDLDVTLSEGYPGAGSPGPQADINNGKGKIVEIRTEPTGDNFPINTIFSTLRLVQADLNIQETIVDIVKKNILAGDIEVINGSNKKVITNWGYNINPLLSPDKTKIAYLSETKESLAARNNNNDKNSTSNNVWIVDTNGENPIQATKYVDGVLRSNFHWLDNDRLLYVDGKGSVKIYSTKNSSTQTIFGPDTPVPNASDPAGQDIYLYNNDYSYLLRFLNDKSSSKITIIDLSTLKTIDVSEAIIPKNCAYEFGPDNKTFVGLKDVTSNVNAILDLTTGKVSYIKK